MGATENELKRDAQQHREQLGDTLEAIGDRLSPERIVERRKAAVGQRLRSVKEAVMGSPEYDESGGNGGLVGRAQSMASSAGDAVQGATEQVQQAPQAIVAHARGNPIAAGIIAFGIGALFASVLPKSRAEQQLVEEARPQLESAAEELKDVGRAVASDAKDRSSSALEEVKAAGTSAATSVQTQARESVQRVTDSEDQGERDA